MANLRSQLDPDQNPALQSPSSFQTERNHFQVKCGLCNALFYVDEGVYQFAMEGMELGLENPFKCDDCEQEYDELSY